MRGLPQPAGANSEPEVFRSSLFRPNLEVEAPMKARRVDSIALSSNATADHRVGHGSHPSLLVPSSNLLLAPATLLAIILSLITATRHQEVRSRASAAIIFIDKLDAPGTLVQFW